MGLINNTFKIFKKDLIISILNFLTSVFIARELGLQFVGIWSILLLISNYIEAFGRTKSDQALIYFIGKKKLLISDAIVNINFILVINLIIIGIFLIVKSQNIYYIFFSQIQKNYIYHYYFLLFTIPFSFLITTYNYIFQALEDYSSYNKIIILEATIKSILIFTLIIFTNLDLWSILIAYFLSPLITFIYALSRLPKNIFNIEKINLKLSIDFLKYGSQFYFNSIVAQVYSSGTTLIATTLLSPQYIGLISIGQKFGELINKAISPVQTTLYPMVSKSSVKNALNKTIKVYRIIFLISSFLTLGLALFMKPLIAILYGEEFIPVTYIYYIFVPGLILESTSLILRSYCNGIGKAIISSYISIIPMTIQLILSLFLINNFGFYGAAFSITTGKILYGILFLIWFLKVNKIKFKQIIPTEEDILFIYNFLKKRFTLKG